MAFASVVSTRREFWINRTGRTTEFKNGCSPYSDVDCLASLCISLLWPFFGLSVVELVLLVTQKLSLLNGFAKRLCFSKWDELTQNTVFSYSDSVKSILRNDAGHTPKKIRYTAYKYKDTDSRRAKIASSKTPVTIGCIKDGDENAKKVTTAMCRALSCTISQHK